MVLRATALVLSGVLVSGCSFDEGGIGATDAAGGADAVIVDGRAGIDAAVIDAVVNDADPSIDAAPDAFMPDAFVPDGPVLDAFVPDAFVPDANVPDAISIDATITYSVVETLTVDCDGTIETSSVTLAAGTTYRLRASGSCAISPVFSADAEYYDFVVPKDTVGGGSPFDVGIGIDDTVVDLTKPPDWGTYTATHIYEVPYPGTGSTITARFYDGNYSNNSGSLTVEILAPN